MGKNTLLIETKCIFSMATKIDFSLDTKEWLLNAAPVFGVQ